MLTRGGSAPGLLRRAFGLDLAWERPLDRRRTAVVDLGNAVLLAAVGVLSMDAARGLGQLSTDAIALPLQYALVVSAAGGLAVRRLFPVAAMSYAVVHYVLLVLLVPDMSAVFVLQVYYFVSLFSVLAWAANRAAALALTVVMIFAAVVWIVAEVVGDGGLDQLAGLPQQGPLSPVASALVQVTVLTLTFFSAAVGGGLVAWWAARREAVASDQAVTIAGQVDQLKARSVAEERLRIARELHDVVGHHVAVMGIQAAAAERLRDLDPVRSAESLSTVQEASRHATRDLRLMLTALRSPDDGDGDGTAVPQTIVEGDGIDGVSEVVDRFAGLGLDVQLTMLGPTDVVPGPVGDCAQRVTQEALTNVQRHSTAARAEVSVTVDEHDGGAGTLRLVVRDHGEAVEVPRAMGAGIGLVGLQERVSMCGGTLQHGRLTNQPGFEVKAAFDWPAEEG